MGLPSYNFPILSWSRDRFLFYLDRTGRQEIYLSSLEKPRARQLSHGEISRSPFRTSTVWDRAGRSFFFGKDVEGNENHDLYRFWIDERRVERLTEDPTSEKHTSDISPDDRFVLILGNLEGRGGRRQLNLWRRDLRTGTLEQLTDYANPVNAFTAGSATYSPDGSWIAYSANETSHPRNADVYRMRSDGSSPELLYSGRPGSQDVPSHWSPDGKLLSVSSDTSGTTRPGLLSLETREVRWLGQEGRDENADEISPGGRWLLSFSQSGVEVRPHLYEVASGKEVPLRLPPGSLFFGQFTQGSAGLLLMHTDVDVPRRIVRYDLRTGRMHVLFESIFGSVDRRSLTPCETVRYPTFDGRLIEALLYRPKRPGRSGAKGGPALLEVHGGPTSQYFRIFNPYAQFFASRGYTLLEPNIRGSTGYGVEFRDLNHLDWGGGDLQDVARGAEYLRSLPGVDPARVGIFGGSFGGFMAYLASVKTPDLWKAACAMVGLSDLELLWKGSKEHFRYYLREQMGDPVENAALWRDRSAVHFAQQLKARILMLHGTNDPRCPVDQARGFRDQLLSMGRTEGVDFEYREFADQGHGSSDLRQKLEMWRQTVEFFDRSL